MRLMAIALTCGLCSASHAGTVIRDGVSVLVPAHWIVAVDAKAGSVVAREDPKRKDAAVMTVAITKAQPGTREDALLQTIVAVVKNPKPIGRDTLPGGKGQAVIVEGTVDGISVRLGAIALVAGAQASMGVLVATPAEFDALGGIKMLLSSLQSLHAVDATTSSIEQSFGRYEKRGDQPDLDPDRPGVPREQLLQSWTHVTGDSMFIEDHRNSTTAYGHRNSHGVSELFTFTKDGTYTLAVLVMVSTGDCSSASNGLETGTYTQDGKTMVLTPKAAKATTTICAGKPKAEQLTITGPRRYEIGLSPDNWLIFVGPGCTEFAEGGCSDHVRWEMTVAKK
jgi:hypothetical protein